MASSWAIVPYWSASPWMASTGATTPGRTASMFQSRKPAESHTSFQPRKTPSASSW